MTIRKIIRKVILGGIACSWVFGGDASAQSNKPVKLECESRIIPLGMDVEKPALSWELQDMSDGAQQTAYEIQVASSDALLAEGKPDIWDSQRVVSGNSIGVLYEGATLTASKRYFWRVLVWGRDGKPYPPSDVSWWETGLLRQENWNAKWIGYEETEHKYVRESGAQWITNSDTQAAKGADKTAHDFRLHFEVVKRVRRATLYVTGQHSASAWINGKQILAAAPLPPWKNLPWRTYTVSDISNAVKVGGNVLAVEVLRYSDPDDTSTSQTPMSAVVYLEGKMVP